MVPVIIDVDTGVDDAIALGLAIGSRSLSLVAVTTVAGNVDVEQATRNTRIVLDWLGAFAVPIARGAARPLIRPHRDAREYHGPDGLGGARLVPERSGPILDTSAPEVIVRAARRYAGALRLVCLGPLTNLAMALRLEPRLPEMVEQVVIMGGAFRVAGNVTPVAEFNVWSDPEAAAIIAEAGFRSIWVGLDVTRSVRFDRHWRERVRAWPVTVATFLAEVSRWSFDERGAEYLVLHDPLAVAVAIEPDIVRTERGTVTIATDSVSEIGRTIWEPRTDGMAAIAVDVQEERFWQFFTRVFGGTQEGTTLPSEVTGTP